MTTETIVNFEANIRNKSFGQHLSRFISICRQPDTLAGVQEKDQALIEFIRYTGMTGEAAGIIRQSTIGREDLSKLIRPLLNCMGRRIQ